MPYRAHMAGTGGLPPFRHHPDLGCADVDPLDVMVPAGYTDREVADARRVCAGCPIWETCLRWAVEHDPNHGVYAGTTPDQRQRIATKVDPWPTSPPPPKPVKVAKEKRRYSVRVNTPDPGRLFDAAREFTNGADRAAVLARYGTSKAVLYRVLRVLRHAPDLVDEVVGRRMTLAAAHVVAQARERAAVAA